MISELLNTYRINLGWLRRLTADLDAEQMVQQPSGLPNHPAWTIGHLVCSCQQIAGEIGMQPWLSADWAKKFGTGSQPTADRNAYPTKSALLHALEDGSLRLAERLNSLTADDLSQPLPDSRHRDRFPTIGHALLHILAAHTAFHIGQFTVWRRAMELTSIPE